jgi:4-hydroxy-2-oxoheptanedioate aldolase
VGTTAASAEAAKALIAKGVQYILLSSDEGIIVKWGKETISRIRG